jgi:ferredoxin
MVISSKKDEKKTKEKKKMKLHYNVLGYQEWWAENKTSEKDLRNLEVRVKEVVCRKPCMCSVCKRTISKGEISLKTSQKTKMALSGIYRRQYCRDCYQTKEK